MAARLRRCAPGAGRQCRRPGNSSSTCSARCSNSLHIAEQAGLPDRPWGIDVEQEIVDHIDKVWRRADQGIWELRGPPQNFTYSKVMAWVGVDRFLKLDWSGRALDPDRRRRLEALRAEIHRRGLPRRFSPARNSFVEAYGSNDLNASLLLLPLVGFLPADDPRMAATIAAIERELVEDGLVHRRAQSPDSPHQGAFLAATCWLADCLGMQRRDRAARAYLERVLALRNDVGLLSEEWDSRRRRMAGNFPQALSHLALVNTALGLCGPVLQRGG